ncbi:unnamed protein product [marine sediment metagenome]|uniref:Uncharacterized protein n=1 Tax=marine sediment metagenome TaxID=412755 RepID=X0VZU3_9ZZZZ
MNFVSRINAEGDYVLIDSDQDVPLVSVRLHGEAKLWAKSDALFESLTKVIHTELLKAHKAEKALLTSVLCEAREVEHCDE